MSEEQDPDYNPNALRPGTIIAGSSYRIVQVLGDGGFGITYEAFNLVTERRVAIKEFFPSGFASRAEATKLVYASSQKQVVAWALERFQRTTSELCRLDHPNIVKVLDYYPGNNTGYMIMEYIDGLTLEDWLLQRKAPPAPRELQPIVEPLFNALEYMHQRNVAHRDVSPDNIMIRTDGTPVLIDFGAMKSIKQDVASQTTTFITTKANYTPPEQSLVGVEAKPSADVYSIAAVLYKAFAAVPPVDAEERKDRIVAGDNDPYVSIGLKRADLPVETIRTIDRGLSFKPDARPQSLTEFSNGIDWTDYRAEPTVVRPLNIPPRDPPGELRPPAIQVPAWRQRSVLAAVCLLAILAAAVLVGWGNPFGRPTIPVIPAESQNQLALEAAGTDPVKLREFLAACEAKGCKFVQAARERLDRIEKQTQALAAAGNDPAKLRAILVACEKPCSFETEINERLDRISTDRKEVDAAGENITKLRAYLNRCRSQTCALQQEANGRLDTIAREISEVETALYDTNRLQQCVQSCRTSSAKAEAVRKLALVRAEADSYNAARGNATDLQRYAGSCKACGFKSAALGEIAAINKKKEDAKASKLYADYDSFGNDLVPAKKIDQPSCVAACRSTEGCKAISYDRWNSTCYLKSALSTFTRDPRSDVTVMGAHSAPEISNEPRRLCIYSNSTIEGDPHAAPTSRPRQTTLDTCRQACDQDESCMAFTYSTRERTCEMFARALNRTTNVAGSTSGAKQQKSCS